MRKLASEARTIFLAVKSNFVELEFGKEQILISLSR
jgi:hypothetical protein